jgi:hypothetical protein
MYEMMKSLNKKKIGACLHVFCDSRFFLLQFLHFKNSYASTVFFTWIFIYIRLYMANFTQSRNWLLMTGSFWFCSVASKFVEYFKNFSNFDNYNNNCNFHISECQGVILVYFGLLVSLVSNGIYLQFVFN